MKASQKDIDSERIVTEIVGHQGFWYEQQDLWSKFLRRSKEIEEICFAQFAKMYKTARKSKADENDGSVNNGIDDFPCINSEDIENQEILEDDKFHLIITSSSAWIQQSKR